MEPETPEIEAHIADLQTQVAPYSKGTIKKSSSPSMFSMFSMLSLNSYKMYLVLLITVFVILLVWRPGIIYSEEVTETGESVRKFSFRKLLVVWGVTCLVIIIAIFAYKYKK